jgi:hypothetical protein
MWAIRGAPPPKKKKSEKYSKMVASGVSLERVSNKFLVDKIR